MQMLLVKNRGALYPADLGSIDYLEKMTPGELVNVKVTRMRDGRRHRKFFAMLRVAFDMWSPEPVEHPAGSGNYIVPEKSPEVFRNWATVKAGYYDVVGLPDGGVKAVPKSIAFDKMEEDEFQQLYSNVLDILLQIPNEEMGRAEFEDAIIRLLDFTPRD